MYYKMIHKTISNNIFKQPNNITKIFKNITPKFRFLHTPILKGMKKIPSRFFKTFKIDYKKASPIKNGTGFRGC